MRILVVDDELPIMQLCVKVLEDEGYAVEGFSRGEGLLARLGEGPADLLVVDYKMPGTDGLQVVRRARDLHPEVRVVMITGHGTPEVLAAAHEAGVNDVLLKPFTPAALVALVSQAANMGGPDMAPHTAEAKGATPPSDSPGRRFVP